MKKIYCWEKNKGQVSVVTLRLEEYRITTTHSFSMLTVCNTESNV